MALTNGTKGARAAGSQNQPTPASRVQPVSPVGLDQHTEGPTPASVPHPPPGEAERHSFVLLLGQLARRAAAYDATRLQTPAGAATDHRGERGTAS